VERRRVKLSSFQRPLGPRANGLSTEHDYLLVETHISFMTTQRATVNIDGWGLGISRSLENWIFTRSGWEARSAVSTLDSWSARRELCFCIVRRDEALRL